MWVSSTQTHLHPARFWTSTGPGWTGYGSTRPVPVWDMGWGGWRLKRVYVTARKGPNNHPVPSPRIDLYPARELTCTRPANPSTLNLFKRMLECCQNHACLSVFHHYFLQKLFSDNWQHKPREIACDCWRSFSVKVAIFLKKKVVNFVINSNCGGKRIHNSISPAISLCFIVVSASFNIFNFVKFSLIILGSKV